MGVAGSCEKETALVTTIEPGVRTTGEPTMLAQMAGAMLQAGAQAAVVIGKFTAEALATVCATYSVNAYVLPLAAEAGTSNMARVAQVEEALGAAPTVCSTRARRTCVARELAVAPVKMAVQEVAALAAAMAASSAGCEMFM